MSAQPSFDGVLPRVQGRHRNRVLAQARRVRAAGLIVSGCTYQQVADQLGYQNRGTVHRLVQPLLSGTRPEGLEEIFELTLARLDGLLKAYYDRALAGDHAAARMVLKILDEHIRLLNLYDRGEPSGAEAPGEVIDPSELVRRRREREHGNP